MTNYTPTQLIAVDVETSGLDPERHIAVEISWVNLSTGERGTFIPRHNPRDVLAAAEPRALQVNRYIERGLWETERHDDGTALLRMWEQFGGPLAVDPETPALQSVFAAVNPAFDAGFVRKAFDTGLDPDLCLDPEPWHYRLRDLGSFAHGAFGLPLDHPPLSVREVCRRLGVDLGDHTAGGDVTAAAECFRRLVRRAEGGQG